MRKGASESETAPSTTGICSFGQEANVILEGGTFNVQPGKSATITNGFHEVDNGNGTWSVVAD